MKINKGDTVLIIKGKDRGNRGKVLRAFPKKERILVEGINLKKRHVRPQRGREKGEIVSVPGPIHVSNAKLICPKCRKPTKIAYEIKNKKKDRVCKKCGKVI